MHNNQLFNDMLALLGRLPSIGPRSARRILIDLIKRKEQVLFPLIEHLNGLYSKALVCSSCFNIDVTNPCSICTSENRNKSIVCAVEDISALWAIERSKAYNGLYFVLGGTLSALHGQNPTTLNIPVLLERINTEQIGELILATSPTVEGQTTAHYIHDCLNNNQIKTTMLAQGIPIGGEIDYLDDITLNTAINLRKNL